MKKYVLKQNKKKPLTVIGILSVIGIVLLSSSGFGIPYASFLQLVGVGFIVSAISIYTGSTVSCRVIVAIDDRPDEISEYPKLYIYTEKGNHNITGKSYTLKFTKILSLEEGERKIMNKRKVYGGRDHIYANFMPERVYAIRYEVYENECELFCDLDSEVASQINERIEKYSGLCELDEE